jgi:hypothetical protein
MICTFGFYNLASNKLSQPQQVVINNKLEQRIIGVINEHKKQNSDRGAISGRLSAKKLQVFLTATFHPGAGSLRPVLQYPLYWAIVPTVRWWALDLGSCAFIGDNLEAAVNVG